MGWVLSGVSVRGRSYSRGDGFNLNGSVPWWRSSDGASGFGGYRQGYAYFYGRFDAHYSVYPYCISQPRPGQPDYFIQESGFPYATYTISYNANGGSGAPKAQVKTWGSNLKLSTTIPKRTGYNFKGWSTSASGSVQYYAGSTWSGNYNATLYAVWERITVKLTFDENGGTSVNDISGYYNDYKTLPSSTKTGHIFKGWSTGDDNTPEVAPGGSVKLTANKTYYACWEAIVYTYEFDSAGGSKVNSITQTYGVNARVPEITPTKRGYDFKGWSVDNKVYQPGDPIQLNKNATLTAVWNKHLYTVRFNASYRGGTPDTTFKRYYQDKLGQLPNAVLKYYVHKGWATTKNATVANVTENTVVDSDATYYAVFELDTSCCTYDDGKWKPSFPYASQDDDWKRGNIWVSNDDEWKRGIGK